MLIYVDLWYLASCLGNNQLWHPYVFFSICAGCKIEEILIYVDLCWSMLIYVGLWYRAPRLWNNQFWHPYGFFRYAPRCSLVPKLIIPGARCKIKEILIYVDLCWFMMLHVDLWYLAPRPGNNQFWHPCVFFFDMLPGVPWCQKLVIPLAGCKIDEILIYVDLCWLLLIYTDSLHLSSPPRE